MTRKPNAKGRYLISRCLNKAKNSRPFSSIEIILFQEIGTDVFNNLFLPELKKNGFDGIFSPKSRAKTMCEDERGSVDGCAIFWHTSK